MNEENNVKTVGRYRPSLGFYHASPKGNGCVAKFTLHPAHDNEDGSIMMMMAGQQTVGNRNGANPTFATFDYNNAVYVKLDFNDLVEILRVFQGEIESVNDGKGLYHRSVKYATSIRVTHIIDPIVGYSIEVWRKPFRTEESETHLRIVLKPGEALGLCEAIRGSLYLVTFGIPMLVEHDTSAYRAETKAMRETSAA